MDIVAYSELSAEHKWLTADALEVAPKLLGWELVTSVGGIETAGRIVEVEAYHGAADPASHAFRGESPRNAPMYRGGGYIYTYRSYGIHTCMNLVTGEGGAAQAVLIRALEPTIGLDVMAGRRGLTNPRLLAAGPRIGISAAQGLPWRFYLRQNRFVSGPRNVAR
ncbi:MAG: DNA-3-methyladenine glycosylase [Candidatus Saccharimonadales bacterium]